MNLLASGANYPSIGSSGTGIYAGRAGALRSVITGRPVSRLLVSEIAKEPPVELPATDEDDEEPDVSHISDSVSDLFQKRDITPYRFEQLTIGTEGGMGDVSYTMDGHECRLRYALEPHEAIDAEAVSYTYFMVIYNGIKSYDGLAEDRLRLCAIVACTNATDVTSCGKR